MFCHIIFFFSSEVKFLISFDIETDGRNLQFHLVETIFFFDNLFIYFLKINIEINTELYRKLICC